MKPVKFDRLGEDKKSETLIKYNHSALNPDEEILVTLANLKKIILKDDKKGQKDE